jgi:hypothetical protein
MFGSFLPLEILKIRVNRKKYLKNNLEITLNNGTLSWSLRKGYGYLDQNN